MPRRNVLGLRGRLIAALILTSALTLAVVAAALLVPLDKRLRADAVRSLKATTFAARPTLGRIPGRDVHPGSDVLRDAVQDIRRRTGDEVAAVAPDGTVLATTEPGGSETYDDVKAAFAGHRPLAGTEHTAEGLEAYVAAPVHRREQPYALSMRRPLSALASATAVVGRGFAFAAGITLAIAVLVGTWVAARLVRRLDALRDDVLKDEIPRDDTHDEVGDLARAFAAMQRRVADQEQARRTFVATASHELRTPLASLRLMLGNLAEELRDDDPDLADARSQVERASAQSERLGRLAADLLDLSRLDAVVGLRDEPVDVGGLARAVAAEFDGVELEADTHVWAKADPGAVARILRILLDNARRFAPPGTHVNVSACNGGDRCELAVSDEGPGVAPTDRQRIFERFERGDGPADDGGFGLGLAIARELAQRMGGDLRLDERARGGRFVLDLPAAHTAALVPAAPSGA
jgi:signal transduction histidine kinase